jgi:hypothetical protein
LLYPNHLRFEAENEYFNPKTGESYQKFTVINEILISDIYDDPREVISTLPKLENCSLDSQLTSSMGINFNKSYSASNDTKKQGFVEKLTEFINKNK